MRSFILTFALSSPFMFLPTTVRSEGSADAPGHGVWLGVQLTAVPDPLADHLQLGDAGLMVRNVFKDSPADQAGIERYDVIVEADGEKVTGDVRAFTQSVGDKKPGDALELDVYHKGQKIHMKVALTTRPRDWDELDRKYEDERDWRPWDDFRGQILRRSPDGWILEDLGPMPHWRDLPHKFQGRLKDWFSEFEPIDEGRRVDKQGHVLHVRQKKDGTIVVKRYLQKDGDSKAETKSFDNIEALKADDPEAYELLQSARKEQRILKSPKDWMDTPLFRRFRDRGENAYKKWHEQLDKYNESIEEYNKALQDWHKRMGESLPPEKWKEWYDRFFQGPLQELKPPAFDLDKGHAPPATRPAADWGVHFDMQPDGKIIVHLHKDDAELSKTFDSEADLKKNAPELYEQYHSLQEQIR